MKFDIEVFILTQMIALNTRITERAFVMLTITNFFQISCLYTESNLKFYIEILSHKVHKQFCGEGQKQVSTPPQSN